VMSVAGASADEVPAYLNMNKLIKYIKLVLWCGE